ARPLSALGAKRYSSTRHSSPCLVLGRRNRLLMLS
ncbi:hypothetical protein AZ020_004782, partial [Enterobacter hormaechei]